MPRISVEIGPKNFFGGTGLTSLKQRPPESRTNRRVPARRFAVIESVLGPDRVLQCFDNLGVLAAFGPALLDRAGKKIFLNFGHVGYGVQRIERRIRWKLG